MATRADRSQDPQWPDWMRPGVRVIRGPDFRSTVKDPKATNLGTLSYVPKQAGNSRVHVVWDTGQERNYSSGFCGQYDLRAYDVQQVGISHTGFKCSVCSIDPIHGIRFQCAQCAIDLCTDCYHGDKHDMDHQFNRIDSPNSELVPLPTRKSSQFVKLFGVYEKTDVIRGPHWNYTGSDGETGRGVVKAFVDEKDGKFNAWVRVKWEVGKEVREYRLGAEGFVDIVASKVTPGGKVYADHLPLLGIVMLKVGDKVTVNMSLEDFKKAQEKAKVPGGWKPEMKQCVAETGTLVEKVFNGDFFRVQYLDTKEHVVSKTALFRHSGFCEKDAVEIIPDRQRLKALQIGHGGTSPDMEKACGKVGRLLKIQADGDMVVLVNGKKLTLSPTCCAPIWDQDVAKSAPPVPMSDSEDEAGDEGDGATFVPEGDCVPGRKLVSNTEQVKAKPALKDFSEEFGSHVNNIKRNQDVTNDGNNMFEAFAKADLDKVKAMIKSNKKLVDFRMEGRTILHLACHEGYIGLVRELIDAGANMGLQDDEGDTPLHYAAFGKQPDCVQELLQNAANPNVRNKNGLTPLLIAIDHPDIDSIQCLILNNADVSLRTDDGETAMHTAIEQKEGQPLILQAVLSATTADHTMCNADNFNVLQWAVFKNVPAAVKIVLDRSPSLVEMSMGDDKYTCLHIAAVNDFVEIAGLMLEMGGAKPDPKDKEMRTPLHLAVVRQHKRTIELLLNKKADVNAQDKDGNTPLHLSQNVKLLQSFRKTVSNVKNDINIQIVYTLLEKGADLYIKNNDNFTPVDLIIDPTMKKMIEKLQETYNKDPVRSQAGVKLPIHWTSMKVTEVVCIKLDLNDTMQRQEYQEVDKHFHESMPNATIASVHRVQNAQLWEHFNLKKREMERKYGQGGANELHLYHGTRPDIVENIVHDNFDFRIAGSRVGALYGDGSYFATTAKYSDLYASQDSDTGFKTMFVAKVLGGKNCLGAPGMKRPPQIDPKDFKKGYYDSVVNNILSPTIYCVFDMNQYYPEYYIEYH